MTPSAAYAKKKKKRSSVKNFCLSHTTTNKKNPKSLFPGYFNLTLMPPLKAFCQEVKTAKIQNLIKLASSDRSSVDPFLTASGQLPKNSPHAVAPADSPQVNLHISLQSPVLKSGIYH